MTATYAPRITPGWDARGVSAFIITINLHLSEPDPHLVDTLQLFTSPDVRGSSIEITIGVLENPITRAMAYELGRLPKQLTKASQTYQSVTKYVTDILEASKPFRIELEAQPPVPC